jgi:hypothetical protein
MLFLEYPVASPLKLGRSSIVLGFLLAGLFTATVTFISVVAVGYELVSITSNSFNGSKHGYGLSHELNQNLTAVPEVPIHREIIDFIGHVNSITLPIM